MEQTFVMLKPGGLQRRIAGDIISRFEKKGLKIIALKLMQLDKATVETHYAEHKGKGFFEGLVKYAVSGPVIAMVLEGNQAIVLTRNLVGPTKYLEAMPGTIRGDYASCMTLNMIHASDSKESAAREIGIFFKKEELCSWEDGNEKWFFQED